MIFPKITITWRLIAKVFLSAISINLLVVLLIAVYLLGYLQGLTTGQQDVESIYLRIDNLLSLSTPEPQPEADQSLAGTPTSAPKVVSPPPVVWGGPELWGAVNKRRVGFGVNQLSQRDELCTIASIRLNELLDLGNLDGHEGFSNMSERRPDLKWIFERYSNIAEFLALGAESPEETVSLWENTLGHKKLLTGGEYVWGCIYAQNTFAVAITAF